MCGADVFTEQLFTVKKLEDFVLADNPLRPIRLMVNVALKRLDSLLEQMHEPTWVGGRPRLQRVYRGRGDSHMAPAMQKKPRQYRGFFGSYWINAS